MEKKGKIKLNQLNKVELNEKEMNRLLGGDNCCICGCVLGSDHIQATLTNGYANNAGGESGLFSPGGGWGNGEFA